MEPKFKPGDVVIRILRGWNKIQVGDINVVERCSLSSIKLKNYSVGYDPKFFALVAPQKVEYTEDEWE